MTRGQHVDRENSCKDEPTEQKENVLYLIGSVSAILLSDFYTDADWEDFQTTFRHAATPGNRTPRSAQSNEPAYAGAVLAARRPGQRAPR